MGVLHVILNALDFDMTMVEAVSAPRFSATSDTIDISNRIQFKVERELKGQGYPVVRSPYGFGFAAVHAIRIHGDGLDGGAADEGSERGQPADKEEKSGSAIHERKRIKAPCGSGFKPI